jgi:hypothetical protein
MGFGVFGMMLKKQPHFFNTWTGFFTVRIDENHWARGQSSRAIISEIGIHFSELMNLNPAVEG